MSLCPLSSSRAVRSRVAGLVAALAALSLGLSSGCSFQADYSGTRYRCDQDGRCPSGMSCVAGFCELPGSNPDAGPDPDPDAGPPASALCATTDRLADDFEAGEIDREQWDPWDSGTAGVSQSGGRLVFGFGSGEADIGSGIASTWLYRFQSSRIAIEVVEIDSQVEVYLVLEVKIDDATKLKLEAGQGVLRFEYELGGGSFELAAIPFDPVAHRFWQLREDQGEVFWETSPDGVTFETQVSAELPRFGQELVSLHVWTWLTPAVTAPADVVVDNANGGSVGDAAWCAAQTLADDFDDGQLAAEWYVWDYSSGNGSCSFAEQNGRLEFAFQPGSYAECGYWASQLYDLTSSTLAVEVPSVADSELYTLLSVWLPDGDYIEFIHNDGMLHADKRVDGVYARAASVPYDPVRHRFWRFRNDGAATFWETSPDGAEWTALISHTAPPLAVDEGNPGLWIWGNPAGEPQSLPAFDNLNVSAP